MTLTHHEQTLVFLSLFSLNKGLLSLPLNVNQFSSSSLSVSVEASVVLCLKKQLLSASLFSLMSFVSDGADVAFVGEEGDW